MKKTSKKKVVKATNANLLLIEKLEKRIATLEARQSVIIRGFYRIGDATKHLFGFGGISAIFKDIHTDIKHEQGK